MCISDMVDNTEGQNLSSESALYNILENIVHVC